MARTILHVDMDAFYASVEQRDHPELRGRPVIVGADPRGRGVVSAASYEARRFGVHSAMPIGRAARLCPDGAFVPVDMDKYAAVSREVMAILAEFPPLLEPVSIDEAFLDVTGTEGLSGDGPTVAATIKARIAASLELTASVGVAANKFVAKVASDLRKPDGLVVVRPGTEADFLAPLPVSRLWGVGRVTAEGLEAMGVTTIGQLAAVPVAYLEARFGSSGRGLHDLSRGLDDRAVEPFAAPKSMGAEETFGRDHRDVERLAATLREQAERVARELREGGYATHGASHRSLGVRARARRGRPALAPRPRPDAPRATGARDGSGDRPLRRGLPAPGQPAARPAASPPAGGTARLPVAFDLGFG